jgi:uncharacterized membrane protein HdeD (DUF308 family)
MADKKKAKEGLMVIGGILLAIAGLSALYATTVSTTDDLIVLAVGLVLFFVGVFVAE